MCKINVLFMKKIFLLFIFVVLFAGGCKKNSEITHYIKALIEFNPTNKVYLLSVYGNINTVVDSAFRDSNKEFYFRMKDSYNPGFYKLSFSKTPSNSSGDITLLYDNESIEISTSFGLPVDSIKFNKSEQNRLYYEFLKIENRTARQAMVLSDIIAVFPKDDPFYPSIEKHYNELKREKAEVIQKASKYKGRLVSSVIHAMTLPYFNIDMNRMEKLKYLKTHFFDHTKFADTLLLNTDILTNKAFGYLQLYRNQQLSKRFLEIEYIKATDSIIKYASINDKTRKQITDYIARGFEQMEMDTALYHLYTEYIEPFSCQNTTLHNRIKTRIESDKRFRVGTTVPEISMVGIDNVKQNLSSINTPYILLLFWATWCPHCQDMLPDLKKIYSSQSVKKIEIFAISIDTVCTSWQNNVHSSGYNWINCCDLKGWNSKIVKDYLIYATPTMFLLDSKKSITAKPTNLDELKKELQLIK